MRKQFSKGKKTIFMALVLILAITMTFSGCSSTGGSDSKQVNLVHTSGPIGSGWYPISVLFNDIWMDKVPGLNLSVIEGGAVGNLRVVNEGKDAQLGLAFTTDFVDAVNGAGPFQKDGKMTKVKAITALYPTWWNIAVLDKSPIKQFEDVIGKHVAPGQPGYASELAFQRIGEAYGVNYDKIKAAGGKVSFGNYADATSQMKDGIVDLVVAGGSPEVSAFKEADALNPLRLIPLSAEALKKIDEKGYGYTTDLPIPAGTYKNQKEDVPAISSFSVLIVNADLDEDTVYKMTKAFWESLDRMNEEQGSRAKWFNLKSVQKGLGKQEYFHPGAIKYYKEIGVMK